VTVAAVELPWVLASAGGLHAVVVDGGAPASIGTDRLELVQHAASAFEAGLLQLWVRDRASGDCWPVLGAGSGSRVGLESGALVVNGGAVDHQGGLTWRVTLTLASDQPAWAWHVEVVNEGPAPRDVDLVHGHDVALAAPNALRTNELYVSQYLDVTPLHGDGFGTALAVRQNLPQAGLHPWCVLAATSPVVAWATDAIDVHGLAARAGRHPAGLAGDLPSRRRQHEHTMATLQTERVNLGPGERIRTSFAGLLVHDHPAATSDADLPRVAEARAFAMGAAPWSPATTPLVLSAPVPPSGSGRPSLAPTGAYGRGREVAVRPLAEDELRDRWPEPWRAVERDGVDDLGELLSFFTADDAHVVTMAKESVVLRPHGTILRTGDRARPDPSSLTTTAWMTGSPLSYLTRGHVSSDPMLTTVRGYLGLHRAYGVRVFVEVEGSWRLLDLPSAFAMTPDSARWVYALAADAQGGVIEVSTVAPPQDDRIDLRVHVSAGAPRRIMLALHLGGDTNVECTTEGVVVRHAGSGHDNGQALILRTADAVSVTDDGQLFDDGRHRCSTVVTLNTTTTSEFAIEFRLGSGDDAPLAQPGHADARPGAAWWPEVTALRLSHGPDIDPLAVSLPWLVRDAFVHFLAPRGLEQYTGGAWGTRDVAQGPLELLLALDRQQDARDLLIDIFAAQESDGSWPQAFGFLPGHEHFRMGPPHGDVVHWPVLALGRYLQASGDASLLEEQVGLYTAAGEPAVPPSTVLTHVSRALDLASVGVLPGTRLVAYGHGDWNDSLQPADPAMGRTLTSSWTVTLHHQALATLADGLGVVGGYGELAASLLADAEEVAADLHRYLVVDGELAGYAQLDPPDADGGVAVRRLLVHPRDRETGLSHGSLQMIHALGSSLFDQTQAAHHVALVREHLMGVDGVRLFDRPPGYHGGPMRHFQRAETATFVGREIGLMYVHAHLRWCEAMAHWGDADALWLGIAQALPSATVQVVPGARRRQANAYPSSSDAAVLDRADFAERYAEVLTGATGLEGGWRIYSSGPGVLVRVIAQSLFGIRRRGSTVVIDPVLPSRLDGLAVEVPLDGGVLRVRYRVGPRGHGPRDVRLAGRVVTSTRVDHPHREGGLIVDLADLGDALRPGGPELEVNLP
jgi:CRISPR-associated protein Csx3